MQLTLNLSQLKKHSLIRIMIKVPTQQPNPKKKGWLTQNQVSSITKVVDGIFSKLYKGLEYIEDRKMPTNDKNKEKPISCLLKFSPVQPLIVLAEKHRQPIKKQNKLDVEVRIAKILCQFLKQLHQKRYVYLTLMPSSIYVIQNNSFDDIDLRFVGFQYCQKLKDNRVEISNTELLPKSLYIAPEVTTKIITTAVDIFSAGKILQLLSIFSFNHNNVTDHILTQMCHQDPRKRSALNKVWQCLKVKQNQSSLFEPKGMLGKPKRNEKSKDDSHLRNQKMVYQIRSPQKKSVEEEERRLRKILHIRNLVIYLHEEANFVLREKNKQLYYLLIKKSVIVRANLIYEIKKMLNLNSGDHFTKLNKIKQTLTQQQNDILNLLSRVETALRMEQHPLIASELERRNQLDEKLLDDQILSFVCKKRREVKPFHSILNQKQRQKLISLCGLAEKLVYGSFQKFFDEVMDENELDFPHQKYFSYLKTASTREILQRIEKIGSGTLRFGHSY